MLNLGLGRWIIGCGFIAQLAAQEPQVLPDVSVPPPPVDTITPVPAPEIPFGVPAAATLVMPKNLKISNFGGGTISGMQGEGIRYDGPGIKVSGDNGLEIFADQAVIDLKAETVTLEGNVSVYQGNILQRGDRTVYYYEKKFLDASGMRISLDPILLEAGKFTVENRNGENVYVGEDAGITTHDVQNPNFWIRSKRTTIFPNDKIVFDDLRVFVGETPVFWLPYLSQPLDAQLGYHFLPGARTNWGPYLLNSYGIMLGGGDGGEADKPWLLSRWRFDIRSTRGLGVGVDLLDTRVENADEISGLSFYYLNDLAPQTRRSGLERGFVNEDRYRIELKNRTNLDFPDDADWRLDSNLTLLSDGSYLEDFEISDYRTDPAPDQTLGIYRRDDASLLSIYARLRLNDFYRADTRMPEIAFDQARAPLFGLPILHEGSTSFGVIGEQSADPTRDAIIDPLSKLTAGDPQAQSLLRQLSGYERNLAEKILALPLNDPRREALRDQLVDSNYARFNTYQEFSLPINNLGGFLNIVPRTGAGYTSYSSVDGPLENFDRSHFHFGTEVSTKFSKDFGDFQNRTVGLDGLKHILQPYAAWSYISTNDFETGDPQVDRLTPTTRPRPLDPARFTAVDELSSWNIIRYGTRNRLLTRRDGQSFEWLYVETYMDAFLNDPEGKRNFSNLYNDIRWQPLPWLSVETDSQFPIASDGSGFSETNSRFRFMPTQNFEFSLGYRTINNHPVFLDSNRVTFQTYSRLNEEWGIGTRHIMELDDGVFELEQYTVHRDLGNWVAAMGLTHRDNRLKEEYGLIFSLTLKDFPMVSLPFEIDGE